MRAVEEYVAGLGLDAYLVGGAVRDELAGLSSKDADFLVPGVDTEALRRALAPHGRVEDLVVAGRTVGLRLHPRNRSVRALAPAGIELAPPRRERSTGPGRHDFEIVVDSSAPVEVDLARRDFTVNAMARRLDGGALVDPFGGRADLERSVLRTVSPRSFAEDPLRLVRGLRLVSQLGLEPDEATLAQMREEAPSVALVSGERVGGGLTADGMGELSKLLLGREPRRALVLARDTGVLVHLLPTIAAGGHAFAVVQAAADLGLPLRVRLAALFHDGAGGAEAAARLADTALRRLRYPNELREAVVRIVRFHVLDVGKGDAVRARRLLCRHGERLALDLVDHQEADLVGAGAQDAAEAEALERLRAFQDVLEGELGSAHRLADLAVDGTDLIQLGYRPGPPLGRALAELLQAVVEEPSLNRRETLLDRAAARLRGDGRDTA